MIDIHKLINFISIVFGAFFIGQYFKSGLLALGLFLLLFAFINNTER